MSIGKEGSPLDHLSDYVSAGLNQKVQDCEAARQEAVVENKRQKEIYLQKTELLRNYLEELAAPVDALMKRFQVWKVLEEVQTKFLRKGFISRELPPIYKEVVVHMDPTKTSFFIDNSWVSLDQLTDLASIQRLVPGLEGYGLTLEHTYERREIQARIIEDPGRYVSNPFDYNNGLSVVSSFGPSGGFVRPRRIVHEEKKVKDARHMRVVVLNSSTPDRHYDLVFENTFGKGQLFPVIIRTDVPSDAFMKVVGDLIVRCSGNIEEG